MRVTRWVLRFSLLACAACASPCVGMGGRATLPRPSAFLTGEFVAPADSGVVVQLSDSLPFVHLRSLLKTRFRTAPKDRSYAIDRDGRVDLTAVSPYARHPAGLSPELLDRLLAMHGQGALAPR